MPKSCKYTVDWVLLECGMLNTVMVLFCLQRHDYLLVHLGYINKPGDPKFRTLGNYLES